jgi:hypothetical protein
VTERGLPLADGASACPFVAFEDDRDERASVPDHRHRCYAESRPAPRAFAHQEAYCLSSAFPVCPTFQDWARREAARSSDAKAAGAGAASGGTAEAAAAGTGAVATDGRAAASAAAGAAMGAASDDGPVERAESLAADQPDRADIEPAEPDADEFGARRNPPRDWAAPPPWLASSDRGAAGPDADAPAFLSHRGADPGQGLAGSAADRLAGGSAGDTGFGRNAAASDVGAFSPGGSDGAGSVAAAGAAGASGARVARNDDTGFDDDLGDRERAGADRPRRLRRPRAYDQHLGGTDGPDWERPRRSEAYPTIKTRVGLPNLPRLGVMAGAIVIAAIALFFLPAILNIGGGGGPAASGSPAASAPAASLAPTEPPASTPILYTIKPRDTLLKIASAHGITLDELLAANPQIKNPNKIAQGDQITIPAPSAAPPARGGGSPAAS